MEVLEKAKVKSEEMENLVQGMSNKYNNKTMENVFKCIIEENLQDLKKLLDTVIMN